MVSVPESHGVGGGGGEGRPYSVLYRETLPTRRDSK